MCFLWHCPSRGLRLSRRPRPGVTWQPALWSPDFPRSVDSTNLAAGRAPVSRPSDRRHPTLNLTLLPDDGSLTRCVDIRRMNSNANVVSTALTEPERHRIDAAVAGSSRFAHRNNIDEVLIDVRERGTRAVVLSVGWLATVDSTRAESTLRKLQYGFPGTRTLALVSEPSARCWPTLLLLGRAGVRTVVDASRPEGWRSVRSILDECESHDADMTRTAQQAIAEDLARAPADCRRFFATLFANTVPPVTVSMLAHELTVLPATLISRFARHSLPSPKLYLAWARLTRAARLLENPGLSVATVSATLEYSSPQGFSRHVKLQLGLSTTEFRRDYTGGKMLARFRTELVAPYIATLSEFRPLG